MAGRRARRRRRRVFVEEKPASPSTREAAAKAPDTGSTRGNGGGMVYGEREGGPRTDNYPQKGL